MDKDHISSGHWFKKFHLYLIAIFFWEVLCLKKIKSIFKYEPAEPGDVFRVATLYIQPR